MLEEDGVKRLCYITHTIIQISDLFFHEEMTINKNCKKNPKPQTRSHHFHKPHSWAVVKSLFTCKHLQPHLEQQPKEQRHRKPKQKPPQTLEEISKVPKKMGPPEHPSSSSPASPSSIVGYLRGIPFRKLSGCYECMMVVDHVLGLTRDPSLRTTICSCPVCVQIFMKPDTLELHQDVRHAVSELGVEDTSRNVVEIIFQSSWLKKHNPICTIDRILKVHNTPKVISRFEEYRDAIKAKANKLPKKHPRCVADGNELLMFQFRSGRQAARCPREAIPVKQAANQQIRRTTVPSANRLSGIFRDRWTWLHFPTDERFPVKLSQGR